MKSKLTESIETMELIEKLRANGYGELVKALLENEQDAYTKRGGRLNKCGACRVLGWKNKQLEEALAACKEILKNDMSDD